jgi:DNA-binding CsgD family transcriptional regulator
MSGLYQAIPLIETGQAAQAREIILSMSRGDPGLQTSRSGRAAAYEVLARAELALGRPAAAEQWAQRAERAIHGGTLVAEAAFARRASAAVALAYGDGRRAASMMLAAAARADAAGAVVEASRCRILAARGLASGDRNEAVTELERAVQDLANCGAHGYRAEAEKELRRLGRRVPRRAGLGAGGLGSLSERERELATLVHRGHTNRQIAAAMYTSEKTVERRLSHMFAKLGVPNRTALALLVAAEGNYPD